MFLVCNGGAVRTDVNWPRCAIIVPCDDGDFFRNGLYEATIEKKFQSAKFKNNSL